MKLRISIGAVLCAGLVSVAPMAFAAPGDAGNGVGGCVDSLYGNATNPRPGGNGVLPSQSPGPFLNTGVNEPPRNDRLRGPSVGDINKGISEVFGPGVNVQDYCRAFGEFP